MCGSHDKQRYEGRWQAGTGSERQREAARSRSDEAGYAGAAFRSPRRDRCSMLVHAKEPLRVDRIPAFASEKPASETTRHRSNNSAGLVVARDACLRNVTVRCDLF